MTFDGTENEICVVLETTDDDIYEFDETLSFQLETDDASVILMPSEANVTIIDDDEGM